VELHRLYTSPDIVRVIKLSLRCLGRVACMRARKNIQNFGWEVQREETTGKM
jgi:hypothetical protein